MNGFLEGIMYGLLLCFLVGPIFFKILHTSITYGKGNAVSLVLGEWVSDIIYILLVFLAAQSIQIALNSPNIKDQIFFYLALIGGSFLIFIGSKLAYNGRKLIVAYKTATLQKESIENEENLFEGLNMLDLENKQSAIILVKKKSYFKEFMEGFLITTFNPFPIFFWLTLMSLTISKNYDIFNRVAVFAGVMVSVISTDLLKISLAVRIQNHLKAKHLNYSSLVCGIILLLFGILLLVKAFLQLL